MKNNFVALVPVRTGSKRVKNKNFREFFEGKSLFDIKIDQLKSTKLFKKIYVSSDSLMVKKLCKKKKVTFVAIIYFADFVIIFYRLYRLIFKYKQIDIILIFNNLIKCWRKHYNITNAMHVYN